MAKSPQTVIGIPGRWPNRSDIVTSIASRSGGYLFAGMVMEPCTMYEAGDLFHNPFGVWKLAPA